MTHAMLQVVVQALGEAAGLRAQAEAAIAAAEAASAAPGEAPDPGDATDAASSAVLTGPAAVTATNVEGIARDVDADAVRAAGGALGAAADSDAAVCGSLFRGMVVWLSREVPREVLMLLVRAFGGTPCWDGPGSPHNEADSCITHAVVDRPPQGELRSGRVHVQPQWIFDSANFRVLVPAAPYAPGQQPPPHLSPFLDYADEGYVPEYAGKLLKLQEAAAAARRRLAGEAAEGGVAAFAEAADAATGGGAAEAAAAAAEREAQFQTQLAEELGAIV